MDEPQGKYWSVTDEQGNEHQVTREDLLRIAGVLKKTFKFSCQDEFNERIDKNADLEGIEGIGPLYAQIVHEFYDLSPELWENLVRLPVHCNEEAPE